MRLARPILRSSASWPPSRSASPPHAGPGPTGCTGSSGPVAPDSPAAKASAAHGFDLSSLDPTCPACQDFAQFATGGWKKTNPIPADRTNWARFIKLSQDNQNAVRGIIEESAAAHAAPGSNTQKVGDYYASCTNMGARNAAGITPIKPLLDGVDATTAADLPATLARLHGMFVSGFFSAGATRRLCATRTRRSSGSGKAGSGWATATSTSRTTPNRKRSATPTSSTSATSSCFPGGTMRGRAPRRRASWRWRPRSRSCRATASPCAIRS